MAGEAARYSAPATSSCSLVRVCLAQDGRLKASFSDNSVLLLTASGSAFVHCSPGAAGSNEQQVFRQLSRYAIRAYAPKLAVAVQFRNMHVDVPFLLTPGASTSQQQQHQGSNGLTLGYKLDELWWPADAAHALQPAPGASPPLAQLLPDGSLAVSACDGMARATLQPNRRRFAVCYPLRTTPLPSGPPYQHAWHTQVFSVDCYPERWHPLVELLLDLAERLAGPDADATDPAGQPPEHSAAAEQAQGWPLLDAPAARQDGQEQPQPAYRGAEPRAPAWLPSGQPAVEDEAGWRALSPHPGGQGRQPQRRTVLPVAADPPATHSGAAMDAPPPAREAPGRPDGFPHGSWWFEPSLTVLPSEELVLLEWTPEATFQFLPASGEVQAWLQGEQQQGQQGGAERAGGHGQGGPYEAGGTQQRRRQQQQQGGGGGGSCLCSERQGRFVRYVGVEEGAGKEGVVVRERLFAAEAVPEHVWVGLAAAAAGEGDGAPRLPRRLPLAKYSAHALKLRELMCNVVARQWRADEARRRASHAVSGAGEALPGPQGQGPWDDLEASFHAQSDEVLECEHVPAHGTFTAYADGRVRAFFADRTVLHLNQAHTHAKAILPDGSRALVAVAQPLGLEPHVRALGDFCKWAFTPAAQRQAAARAHGVALVAAGAAARTAKLLEWSLDGGGSGRAGAPTGETPLALPAPQQSPAEAQAAPPRPAAAASVQAQVALLLKRNAELIAQL